MSSKIRSFRHKWKVLGAVASLLLLGAVLPLTTASATSPIAFAAGSIKLHMNTDASYFKQYDASGDEIVGATQAFKAGTKCNYTPVSGPTLIAPTAFGPSGTVVGYLQKDNGYGLGVNRAGKEGTGSCTQTNLNEKLTLELKNDGTPSSLQGLYVSDTKLDMEFKYNAVLNAAFFLDGTQVGTLPYGCLSSDCGPDSGGGDNYEVHLQAPVNDANPNGLWDKVELTVSSSNTQAAVTLEGGNDVGTSDSIFNLSQLLTPITCGSTVQGDGGGTHVNVTLVANDCVDKGYSLAVTPDGRTIELNSASNTTHKDKWIVDVAWTPEAAGSTTSIKPTTVFPPPGGEAAVWCDGAYSPAAPGGTLGAIMPSGHSWCLIKQSAQIAGGGQIKVFETFLLEADAKICRCT
jgi:hypothetical protein